MDEEQDQPEFSEDAASDAPQPQDVPPPDPQEAEEPDLPEPPPDENAEMIDLKAQVEHLANALGVAEATIAEQSAEISELTGWKDAIQDRLDALARQVEDIPSGANFVDPLPDVFPAKDPDDDGIWTAQELVEGSFVDGKLTNSDSSGDFAPIELDDDMYILIRKFGLSGGVPKAQYIKVSTGSGGSASGLSALRVLINTSSPGTSTSYCANTYDVWRWDQDPDVDDPIAVNVSLTGNGPRQFKLACATTATKGWGVLTDPDTLDALLWVDEQFKTTVC